MNVPFPCDLGSAYPLATLASNWAKQEKSSLVTNVILPCDLPSSVRVTTCGSTWAEEVNRSVLKSIPLPCDLGWAYRVERWTWKWTREGKRTLIMNVPLLAMSHQLANSQRLVRTEESRGTNLCSMRFFDTWFSMSCASRNVYFVVSKKTWTEVWLCMFFCKLIFDQRTELQILLRSQQNTWTEMC